jgi:hypothetical protein
MFDDFFCADVCVQIVATYFGYRQTHIVIVITPWTSIWRHCAIAAILFKDEIKRIKMIKVYCLTKSSYS